MKDAPGIDTVADLAAAGLKPERARARLFELGSVAQSSVPGAYAWFVTVAPTAWARGAPVAVKVLAVAGLLTLALTAVFEHRFPRWARIVSVWGFTSTSALVWALMPTALGPTRLDTTRGITGMIGWALFAYACAAPAVPRSRAPIEAEGAPLKPRDRLPRGDAIFIGIGIVLAVAIQFFGWRVASPERAVLVRLACVALGMTTIGTATSIALARHATRKRASPRGRLRIAVPWVLAVVLIGIAGLAYRLAR
jgi:hypothetical protein